MDLPRGVQLRLEGDLYQNKKGNHLALVTFHVGPDPLSLDSIASRSGNVPEFKETYSHS